MNKTWWLFAGIILLIALEILKVYFIMPFPGSQRWNTVALAYFLHRKMWWLRIIGIAALVSPAIYVLSKEQAWKKWLFGTLIIMYIAVLYLFNVRFLADRIFYVPKQKIFLTAAADTTNKDKLVMGVVIGKEAKAYPIEIIGYHHQVQDSVNQQPVLVTYCTVCRTARVFFPMVDGKYERFRLVGMDHFNALLEDEGTKSWWQQSTGEAVAGKLMGSLLTEIPSAQMRLGDWLDLHPDSKIMQPDTNFRKQYAKLNGYDEGLAGGQMERRDSLSWQPKSWVIGITIRNKNKAYDWNDLLKERVIIDSLDGTPLLITIAPDNRSYYVSNRTLMSQEMNFVTGSAAGLLQDTQTHSTWKINGVCIDGALKGSELLHPQASQEFWHAWKNFHPNTVIYKRKV